jgi:hypothetical protein
MHNLFIMAQHDEVVGGSNCSVEMMTQWGEAGRRLALLAESKKWKQIGDASREARH